VPCPSPVGTLAVCAAELRRHRQGQGCRGLDAFFVGLRCRDGCRCSANRKIRSAKQCEEMCRPGGRCTFSTYLTAHQPSPSPNRPNQTWEASPRPFLWVRSAPSTCLLLGSSQQAFPSHACAET